MKETYYEIDDKKFQQLAKNWYTQKTAWKMLRLLSWFFLLAGVASIVVVAGIAFQPPVPDIKIALMIAPMGLPFRFFALPMLPKVRPFGSWESPLPR